MNRDAIMEQVGRNIRLYRKNRAMTLDELAERIHKSRSSISKYESGQVSIDLLTLLDIAKVLHVAPTQLFDVVPERVAAPDASLQNSPFYGADTLYMYNLYDDEVFLSIFKLSYNHRMEQMEATLFYRVEDMRNLSRCYCIYHGEMVSKGPILSFTMNNNHNDMETILVNFTVPMRNFSELIGMCCGLEVNTFEPVVLKVVLSRSALPVDEALRNLLTFSPSTFKELKAKNKLFIRRT